MPEKKFVISPGKRIFSRVEQECGRGSQGWNGSVLRAGQGRGAPVGAGQESGACGAGGEGKGREKRGGRRRRRAKRGERAGKEGGGKSQGEETEVQRGTESRGGEHSPKESLSLAARNERMRPGGLRREERTAAGTEERTAVRGSCGIVEGRRGRDMQARRTRWGKAVGYTRGHRGCAREARQEVARNQLCRKREDGFMLPTPGRAEYARQRGT